MSWTSAFRQMFVAAIAINAAVLGASLVSAQQADVPAPAPAIQEVLKLLSSDAADDLDRALTIIESSDFVREDASVRSALLMVFQRENEFWLRHNAREDEPAAGETTMSGTQAHAAAEGRLRMIRVVMGLRHRDAIKSLTYVLYTSRRAVEAVAAFGEEAIPYVRGTWLESETIRPELRHGLHRRGLIAVLARIATRPLSPANRDLLIAFARERLSTAVNWSELEPSIDLAIALQDSELLDFVREIAADPNSLAARGVLDPWAVKRIQDHAKAKLSQLK